MPCVCRRALALHAAAGGQWPQTRKGTGLTAEKPQACDSSAACTEFPKELRRAGVNLPASARGKGVKVCRAGNPNGSHYADDS